MKRETVERSFAFFEQIGEFLGNPDNEIQDKLVNGAVVVIWADGQERHYKVAVSRQSAVRPRFGSVVKR